MTRPTLALVVTVAAGVGLVTRSVWIALLVWLVAVLVQPRSRARLLGNLYEIGPGLALAIVRNEVYHVQRWWRQRQTGIPWHLDPYWHTRPRWAQPKRTAAPRRASDVP